MLLAKLTQRAQECRRGDPHAAFALNGLDKNRRRRRPDRALDRFKVAERHLVEAVDRRSEAFQIFLVTGCGDRSQSAPMEGAFKCDDAIPLRLAGGRLIFAHHLDRALDRLGAGILEEHGVGEADCAQPVGEPFALRDAVKIGDVPDLVSLLGERVGQVRMRMAQRIDGNAGGEIQIPIAFGREQPCALASLKCEVDARICRQ